MIKTNRRTSVSPTGEKVLCFIRETVSETEQFPSRAQIAARMGWDETDRHGRVLHVLLDLVGAGVLQKTIRKNRYSFMLPPDRASSAT